VRQFCTLAEAGDFPNLRANLDSWLCFMSTRGKKGLIATRTSPGSLFDAWISWSMEYEQETLRQKIASQKTASL